MRVCTEEHVGECFQMYIYTKHVGKCVNLHICMSMSVSKYSIFASSMSVCASVLVCVCVCVCVPMCVCEKSPPLKKFCSNWPGTKGLETLLIVSMVTRRISHFTTGIESS